MKTKNKRAKKSSVDPRSEKKLARAVQLKKLLGSGRRWKVSSLAAALKVTTRTVYPMIADLASQGVPLARTLGKGDVAFFVTRKVK